MSTRLFNHGDDISRRQRDTVGPASAPRRSRETVGSSAIPSPEPSVSARGTIAHTRSEAAFGGSPSHTQPARDAQERMAAGPDGSEALGRSTTPPSKDYGSTHSSKGGGSKTRDAESERGNRRPASSHSVPALQPRLLEEQDQPRYDWAYAGDRRDALRGMRYPSHPENYDVRRPSLAHAKSTETTTPASSSFQLLYETQSRELSALQIECRAALEEKKEVEDTYAALQRRYEERSKKLSVARQERQLALDQRKQADDAYVALKLQYDEQLKRLNTARHERQAALDQKQKVEEECAALREKYGVQKNEQTALSNKYHSLKAMLDQRTSELQGVQKFLTTADTFSGAEVVNMLRKLNDDVQQTTTYMAEWAVENLAFGIPDAGQLNEEHIEQTRASECLGMRLMQLLATRKHKDNPILIEMAFRAYLIYSLYWIASSWSMSEEEQSHNVYVDAIYQRIREAEGQAISGNWRALTRAYTLPACISDPELTHNLDTTIISGFADILLASGCTTSKSDVSSALWTAFGDKVHHFVSLAGQVNKIIGVGVVSEDFEVLVVWPDATFDGKQMEDAYDSGDRVRRGEVLEDVLCATDLGLMQRIKVGAGAGERGEPSELVVIKPKVALTSVLSIIDE